MPSHDSEAPGVVQSLAGPPTFLKSTAAKTLRYAPSAANRLITVLGAGRPARQLWPQRCAHSVRLHWYHRCNLSTLALELRELRELLSADGSRPFGQWFESLDVQATAKVVTATLRLEQGNLANVKWFSGIGEYRIDWGPGSRIYLTRDGANTLLLLGGGTKRYQWRDVERALSRWDEYKRSKSRR